MRAFHQSLTVKYRQGYVWWSAVELARRLVFLLFIVALPDNEVGAGHLLYLINSQWHVLLPEVYFPQSDCWSGC